jgi:hypothetical protein
MEIAVKYIGAEIEPGGWAVKNLCLGLIILSFFQDLAWLAKD